MRDILAISNCAVQAAEGRRVLILTYILMGLAAVCFVSGAVTRFFHAQEGTVWYRGAMGLLMFAQCFLLLQILRALRPF